MEAETGTVTTEAVVAMVTASAMEMVVVATVTVSAMETAIAMGITAMGKVIVTVKADILVVEEAAAGMVTVGITGTPVTAMRAEIARTGTARAGKMATAGTTARQMVLPFLSHQSARRVDGIAKSLVSH